MTYNEIADFFVKLMEMPVEDFEDCFGKEASVVGIIGKGKSEFDKARTLYRDYYSRDLEPGDEVDTQWIKGIYLGKIGDTMHMILCKNSDGSLYVCRVNRANKTGRSIPTVKAFMEDLAKWEF